STGSLSVTASASSSGASSSSGRPSSASSSSTGASSSSSGSPDSSSSGTLASSGFTSSSSGSSNSGGIVVLVDKLLGPEAIALDTTTVYYTTNNPSTSPNGQSSLESVTKDGSQRTFLMGAAGTAPALAENNGSGAFAILSYSLGAGQFATDILALT